MNAKKVKPFLFVPLQPWRRRSDHNRNLGFPVAQHHTQSRGRRQRRGGRHAGDAWPADMGGEDCGHSRVAPLARTGCRRPDRIGRERECRRNMVGSLPRGMPKVVDYRQTDAQATNKMMTQDKHEVLSRFGHREGVIPTSCV